MVSRKICRKCVHDRKYGGALGPHCGYMLDAGKSRTAQMTPEQIRSGECPFFEAGRPKRVVVKPFIVSPDPLARLTEGPPMYAVQYRLDQDRLLTLYDKGLTDREIADEMGCAKDSVRLWRKRKELPPNGTKPKNRVDYKAVRELYMDGLNDKEIAREVGAHPHTILDWRRAEGLPANSVPGKKAPLSRCGDSSPGGGAEGEKKGENK